MLRVAVAVPVARGFRREGVLNAGDVGVSSEELKIPGRA